MNLNPLNFFKEKSDEMENEKLNLVVIDVQKSGIKVYGPMSDSLVVKWLINNCGDQPLARVAENPRLYIANLETGVMTKPKLNLIM